MKNKHIIRSRISEQAFRNISKLFCIAIEASKTAEIMPMIKQKPAPRQSFIVMDSRLATAWLILVIRSMIALSIRPMSLLMGLITATALKTSGGCAMRLRRCRGIHEHKFYDLLKECAFRFKLRPENIDQCLLKLIRENPLKVS